MQVKIFGILLALPSARALGAMHSEPMFHRIGLNPNGLPERMAAFVMT
jgi:hypothetical protein